MAARPSSDLVKFRKLLSKSQNTVVLTGAGVSAESGVPTFRGPGGYWRKWKAQAHKAIADCEKRFKKEGRNVTVITQNIDGLHKRSGSENIIELHGNLFKTRCLKCGNVEVNNDSPICEALRDKGEPNPDTPSAIIHEKDLPRCKKDGCDGLLRPHVIWFGECLEESVLDATDKILSKCDLCLVVGTSSVVYPAASFAPSLAARGVPVAEFNMEETDATNMLGFHFQGPAGVTLPKTLAP